MSDKPLRKKRSDAGLLKNQHKDVSYGFRLNPGEPGGREKKAIGIIGKWRARINPATGKLYDLRWLMTESVIAYGDPDGGDREDRRDDDPEESLKTQIQRLEQMIEKLLENGITVAADGSKSKSRKTGVPASYLQNLKRALKSSDTSNEDDDE